jgi:hypothetical protein
MSYSPNNANGQATMANSAPVTIASNQSAVAVTAAQATASNLNATVVGAGTAGTPSGGVVSVQGVSSGTALPVSGTVTANISGSIANTSFAATQTTASNLNATVVGAGAAGTPSGGVVSVQGVASGTALPVSGTVTANISGSIANTSFAATQTTASSLNMTDATGTNIQGTVSAGTAASKSALVGYVYSSTTPTVTNGQQIAAQCDPYGNHLVISPDLYVIGQSAQTALVNNILTTTAGSAATDALGYHSAAVQLICPAGTYTTGQVTFEGSNDNVNFQTIPVYSQSILTGTPIVAAITLATTTSLVYTFPIQTRYIRCRISTAISGASAQVQAFTKLSVAAWSPGVVQVAQGTAANLQSTATIASGTVTTVSTVTSVSAVAAINSVATTNGLSLGTQISPATPAILTVKGSAGRLHFLSVGNPNTSAVYLKLFNQTSVTLGTTSATMNFYIPQSSVLNIPINDVGLYFGTGIILAVTGGASLSDNTAITTGCEVNYSYI